MRDDPDGAANQVVPLEGATDEISRDDGFARPSGGIWRELEEFNPEYNHHRSRAHEQHARPWDERANQHCPHRSPRHVAKVFPSNSAQTPPAREAACDDHDNATNWADSMPNERVHRSPSSV